MLIENNKILRFGLHLPLAEDFKMTNVGTRHRAAVGITERIDALNIVVSEERGTVSVAEGGALRTVSNEADLIAILKVFIKETTPNEAKSFWQYFVVRNVFMKIASFIIAFVLWLIFIFHV